jgi:hypothetical protein
MHFQPRSMLDWRDPPTGLRAMRMTAAPSARVAALPAKTKGLAVDVNVSEDSVCYQAESPMASGVWPGPGMSYSRLGFPPRLIRNGHAGSSSKHHVPSIAPSLRLFTGSDETGRVEAARVRQRRPSCR